MVRKQFLVAFLVVAVLGVYLQFALASTVDRVHVLDLSDLIKRQGELEGEAVEVTGKARYYVSFLMHEDFWLEDEDGSKIPVGVRQSMLPLPDENARIRVKGKLIRHEFEGGFYSIHADSWEELTSHVANAIPK